MSKKYWVIQWVVIVAAVVLVAFLVEIALQ